jgi:hypothetical protein
LRLDFCWLLALCSSAGLTCDLPVLKMCCLTWKLAVFLKFAYMSALSCSFRYYTV